MSNDFKAWIQATKNDTENLEHTKTFLKALLLMTDDIIVEHYSEIQLILNYLESDETEVSRRVEMSVANLLKVLSGGNDSDNNFSVPNLREMFNNKNSEK
ncbi:MAG: hypothetical protein ACRC41_01365 [Sarcina sp.]